MRSYVYVVLFAALLNGCANPINQKTASNYYDWGLQAELAGDYVLAERNYERALINARLGHSPDAGVSAAMYSLGRMKGYLCKYDDAEKLLLESLTLEEKATGLESGITTKRLFELARFYSDRGLYPSSLPYFARGIPAVKTLGIETSDPIAFAEALDEYATALEKSGRGTQTESVKNEAESIRRGNSGKSAKFTPVRYNRLCTK